MLTWKVEKKHFIFFIFQKQHKLPDHALQMQSEVNGLVSGKVFYSLITLKLKYFCIIPIFAATCCVMRQGKILQQRGHPNAHFP